MPKKRLLEISPSKFKEDPCLRKKSVVCFEIYDSSI